MLDVKYSVPAGSRTDAARHGSVSGVLCIDRDAVFFTDRQSLLDTFGYSATVGLQAFLN